MKTQPLWWGAMILMFSWFGGAAVALQAADADEKEMREAFKKEFGRNDAERRLAAIQTYDADTRGLLDEGKSRLVAKTLAGGLTDDDMAVCQAAVSAMSYGRDVETAIDGLEDGLSHYRKVMGKTATRPDTESRNQYRGALDAYRAACAALANYKDDRSTKHLEAHFKKINPGGSVDNVSQNLVSPLAEGLLALGSQRSVKVVIDQTKRFTASIGKGTSNREQVRQNTARSLHDALASFARSIERVPPEFGQNYQQDWTDWFKQNKDLFPDKLGKLTEPPGPPSSQPMDRGLLRGGRDRP